MMRMLSLCCLFAGAALSAAEPDFAAATRETVGRIQDLVRLDTSNPPGHETRVVEYLRGVLEREGLAAGDTVVVHSERELAPGSRIEVVDAIVPRRP